MKKRRTLISRKWGSVIAVAALLLLAVAAVRGRFGVLGQASPSLRDFNATELSFSPGDRILVLAPHPDDESLGTGGVIQEAVREDLPVHVAFLTNGDANEWSFTLYARRPELLSGQVEAMGEVRHNEAVAAANILGLKPDQLTFFGYPDFGTLRIWTAHWRDEPPARSLFTRVTQVPYKDAYRPGAAYKGEDILADLEAVIGRFKPTEVFVSHPADYNPDHEALYLFTRVALWDLGLKAEVYPYLVHTPGWPVPRGPAPALPLAPPPELAPQENWWTLPLTRAETNRKLAALQQHRTQYQSNGHYLSSFVRANELFGDYWDTALPAGEQVGPDATRPDTRAPEILEGLTEEERAKFVGVEWKKIEREGDNLILTAALSKPLAEGVGLSAYLFGYRPDTPFASMPKIHVRLGALSHAILDQSRPLNDAGVMVSRSTEEIAIRVPLSLLSNPDRAFVSARTYLGDMPLDSSVWRVLDFKGE
ncbi:MAG: PIG-L deacetylase family protein [Nitrososphaerales archaeon]